MIFWVFCGLSILRGGSFPLPIFSKHRTRNYLGRGSSSLGYASSSGSPDDGGPGKTYEYAALFALALSFFALWGHR